MVEVVSTDALPTLLKQCERRIVDIVKRTSTGHEPETVEHSHAVAFTLSWPSISPCFEHFPSEAKTPLAFS
jgi:hypothetical protein